ncbi:hypothetical protein [Tunturiibacter gelidiferens]|uniref:hypothetical protein n=1 Tax=Tunturiibacter gelidiferens TaxID=3069689 RepID=UPI003D9B1F94
MGNLVRPGAATDCTASTHREWLADSMHWRKERRIRIGYDGSRYNLPQLQWAEHSFMQPQMMAPDRYLYDPATGKYTVDRYGVFSSRWPLADQTVWTIVNRDEYDVDGN